MEIQKFHLLASEHTVFKNVEEGQGPGIERYTYDDDTRYSSSNFLQSPTELGILPVNTLRSTLSKFGDWIARFGAIG
jgi:hypothetical protein